MDKSVKKRVYQTALGRPPSPQFPDQPFVYLPELLYP